MSYLNVDDEKREKRSNNLRNDKWEYSRINFEMDIEDYINKTQQIISRAC